MPAWSCRPPAHMGLQTEVPLVALPRLMHLGGRTGPSGSWSSGTRESSSIHNRACRDADASFIQMQAHFLQHRWAQARAPADGGRDLGENWRNLLIPYFDEALPIYLIPMIIGPVFGKRRS